MTRLLPPMVPVAAGVLILVAVLASPVAAHTGEGISLEHVILEVGTWALAIVGVIAAVIGIFWVRARASRR